jgi:hypothetical protein
MKGNREAHFSGVFYFAGVGYRGVKSVDYIWNIAVSLYSPPITS